MVQSDAPFDVRPRLDPVLWRWLWQFARRCNWADFEQALNAKARLLLSSRRLLGELIRSEVLDCEFAECGHLTVFRDPAALAAFDWWPRAAFRGDRSSRAGRRRPAHTRTDPAARGDRWLRHTDRRRIPAGSVGGRAGLCRPRTGCAHRQRHPGHRFRARPGSHRTRQRRHRRLRRRSHCAGAGRLEPIAGPAVGACSLRSSRARVVRLPATCRSGRRVCQLCAASAAWQPPLA